jgi:hypothetical protein
MLASNLISARELVTHKNSLTDILEVTCSVAQLALVFISDWFLTGEMCDSIRCVKKVGLGFTRTEEHNLRN